MEDQSTTGGEREASESSAPLSPSAVSLPTAPDDLDAEFSRVGPTGLAWPPSSGEANQIAGPEPAPPSSATHRRRTIVLFLVAVLAATAVGAAIGVAASSRGPAPPPLGSVTDNGPSPFRAASSLAAIATALTPSVVDIDTSVDEPGGIGEAAGSGMILTSSGEVLTNNHVIEDATKISVTISGRPHPVIATVVGVDTVHDVALLQLSGVAGLAHVDLGNSADLSVGENVVAIGNALGLGGAPAATGGSVSSLHQSIKADSEVTSAQENLTGLIETDAQIQPGDSGGPLVNARGQVVGMDTAAASSAGGPPIGFAIPINQAIDIARNIENGVAGNGVIIGASAFMGVYVENVPYYVALQGRLGPPCGAGPLFGSISNLPSAGQVVSEVACGGPAVAAGIVPGDTIVAVDGSTVTNAKSSLQDILSRLRPGQRAQVKIVSATGATSTHSEVLGALPT